MIRETGELPLYDTFLRARLVACAYLKRAQILGFVGYREICV